MFAVIADLEKQLDAAFSLKDAQEQGMRVLQDELAEATGKIVTLEAALEETRSQVVAQKKLLDTCREVRALKEFDAAFDLQGLMKSGAVVGYARAKKKLGYHWQREGSWLFSQRVLPDKSSLHVTDQYVDVVRAGGATMDRAEFDLAPNMADVAKVRGLVPTDRPLALCNAGAGWVTKRWPPDLFASLCNMMNEQGWAVAFIGGPADGAIVAEIQNGGC